MSSVPGAGAAALLDAAPPPTFWPVPVLADALSFSLQGEQFMNVQCGSIDRSHN
jgi:hypothetical protein